MQLLTFVRAQVILDMCKEPDRFADALNESVVRLADRGYRPVAVGKTNEDGDWEVLGVLSLFDPPRDDTALVRPPPPVCLLPP